MAFRFRKRTEATTAPDKPSGGWYADPYGTAARRWYDDRDGWTDRVQGEGPSLTRAELPGSTRPPDRSSAGRSARTPGRTSHRGRGHALPGQNARLIP